MNLLDNYDFGIAQAGYGGMHGSNRYAADRWQNLYQFGTFAAANPGIVMTYETNHAYAVQKIANSERYVGKTLTFGVMTDEYGLLLCTGLYIGTTLAARIFTSTCEINIENDSVRVIVLSGTLTVRWAALYEGTYTADTFPPPAPRPYSTELAECQRYYYQTWVGPNPATTNGVVVREAITDMRLGGNVALPVEMRVTPTITFYNSSGVLGVWKEWVNGTILSVSSGFINSKSFVVCVNGDSANKAVKCLSYAGHYCASCEF